MLKTESVYHGTDSDSANEIILTHTMNKSCNMDDWLGSGIYFYDKLDNAILYNIRKYINKNEEYPTYDELVDERKIVIVELSYSENDELDLNDIENIRKFLGLWKMFYDEVKYDDDYNSSKYQDGYMINWLFENTDYFNDCKIVTNIFNLDLKFRRNIDKIFLNQTRIGYTLSQKYICVVDRNCITDIKLYDKKIENEYNKIKDLTNNILMVGD